MSELIRDLKRTPVLSDLYVNFLYPFPLRLSIVRLLCCILGCCTLLLYSVALTSCTSLRPILINLFSASTGSSQTKILQRRQLSAVKIIHGRSLFLFSTNNRFRLFCHSLVSLKHFDHIMLVIIILSSIILAMEDPLVVSSRHNDVCFPVCKRPFLTIVQHIIYGLCQGEVGQGCSDMWRPFRYNAQNLWQELEKGYIWALTSP